MVRKDGAEARRDRMEKIGRAVHSALEASNGEISLDKTVSEIAIQMGLTENRIMEYLTIYAKAGHWILDIEGDKIQKPSFENADSDG